jgi:hypothetical protein
MGTLIMALLANRWKRQTARDASPKRGFNLKRNRGATASPQTLIGLFAFI